MDLPFSLCGIYTRSSVFIFIIVSKSAYFLGSDGVTKRQFQQTCPWATFWEKDGHVEFGT